MPKIHRTTDTAATLPWFAVPRGVALLLFAAARIAAARIAAARIAAAPPLPLRKAPARVLPAPTAKRSPVPAAPLVVIPDNSDALRQQVIDLTNRERAAQGLPPLVPDPLLMQSAQSHAQDMLRKDYFSHTDKSGGHPWDRMRAVGYISGLMGENIAWGQETPSETMDAWMRSVEHRENILQNGFRAIGIGVAGKYWVQDFGDVITRVGPAAPRRSFGDTRVADGDTVPKEQVLADFESQGYQGWEMSGNCWGRGPEGRRFAGNVLTGWRGLGFATSAHPRAPGLDSTSGTGRALSPKFTIPPDATAIRFRIAGGHYPNRCCLNLLIGDKVVRTAAAESAYSLEPTAWDITDLRGRTARLEIRDEAAAGTNAFLHVDDVILVR